MSQAYAVVVGNIGTVYHGTDETEALRWFVDYRDLSRDGYGRAAGESVTLMVDGEPREEYIGSNQSPEETGE